jgi:hypothetical protein
MIRRARTLSRSACLVLFCALFPAGSAPCRAEIRALANGDRISWDGAYYDFRDAAGVRMIKMWVPPGVRPVRGVFLSGHGGGSGDSRNFARDENVRAFAMRLGFAVAGLHHFPGRNAYDEGARVFFGALDAFGAMGRHPELAHLPFVMYGSSNGGAATYGFVNFAPERAICFTANVSAGYHPEEPVPGALKVPGLFIVGKFDALIGQRGVDRTAALVAGARARGALWTWALELEGHEDGASFDVYMKLVEQAVAARYPEGGDPSKGPVALKALEEKDGWLVDLGGWDSGLTPVDAYGRWRGDRKAAGWVLNENMAFVYRSLATHQNPLSLKVREFDRTFNPHTDPGTMFSLGGPVAAPGDRVTPVCDAERFPGWERIELFNGAEKLGEVRSGRDPEFAFTLDARDEVVCLTALASDRSGNRRTCDPLHFFVRDPALNETADPPRPVFARAATGAGSKNAGKAVACKGPDPADSVLVAYGLDAGRERRFSAHDGRVSDFWAWIDGSKDAIRLTQKKNAAPDAAFNPVLTHDCNMTVKAAYGAGGLYLLFEVNDDRDTPWPNRFAGTENEQFYLHFDAVDALLDSRPLSVLCGPDGREALVSRSYGLTFTTRQYQVACGTEKERPGGFKRGLSDPWDFFAAYHTFPEAERLFGIRMENVKTDHFFKAQEWFIPWSEVGGGFPSEPDAGTRIAFAAGYNDRDEGEHLPPGVTSSGGSVKASNALRWIGNTDPWGSSKPPYAWGEIELGEMMK